MEGERGAGVGVEVGEERKACKGVKNSFGRNGSLRTFQLDPKSPLKERVNLPRPSSTRKVPSTPGLDSLHTSFSFPDFMTLLMVVKLR